MRHIHGIARSLAVIAAVIALAAASLALQGGAGVAYAADGDITVLAFTSDVHNTQTNSPANRLGTWIDKVNGLYAADGGIDVMTFCGDLANSVVDESEYWPLVRKVMDVVEAKGVTGIYTTGNHEHVPGHLDSQPEGTRTLFKINEQVAEGSNYRIYCLGSVTQSANYGSQVSSLRDYLGSVDDSKPVFIATHYPLHYAAGRATGGASEVIDVLNAAADDGKEIIFLWGHNHSYAGLGETHYDEVFAPGSVLQFAPGAASRKTIRFYYAAAGCMCDDDYSQASAVVKGKGLVVTVGDDGELAFRYHNQNGCNVTEGGTYSNVAVKGVTIAEPNATVEIGKIATLHAVVEPAGAINTKAIWSSDDPSIAKVGSSTGKVTGVSEGSTTITVSLRDTCTGECFTASTPVTVSPRNVVGQYYVIAFDDCALGSKASPGMMRNDDGFEYHGLEAVPYAAGDPVPHGILWELEPVGGTENGFRIKSYGGEYLSATYLPNANGTSSYTGTLAVGETPDVWIAAEGFDGWHASGTWLQSSNASINGRDNLPMFLGLNHVDGADFVTVHSAAAFGLQGTSTLVPVDLDQAVAPVVAADISLEPSSLEVEAGLSATITATVLPNDAEDGDLVWISSDESVATVSDSGSVRGIAPGTATITAQTVDGGCSATCPVTVAPRTSPALGYVIEVDGFALSSIPLEAALVRQGSSDDERYRYFGFQGIPFDEGSIPPDECLWHITETEGGYLIQSGDGRYLNATYESNGDGGYDGILKLDGTPDVWSLDGGLTLEDWSGNAAVSGSRLKSGNSGRYLTHEEGNQEGDIYGPPSLFTVRSEGDTTTLIDTDNASGTDPFRYLVEFVDGNGNLIKAMKLVAGEVPTCTGITPVGAGNAQDARDFVGWSSDGGATIFGPDQALPAVADSVTYVAQFRKHVHSYGAWQVESETPTKVVESRMCIRGDVKQVRTTTITYRQNTAWKRVWGATAPITMQEIAKEFGGTKSAVVTTDSSYKDALAASALAGKCNGLVLMTKKGSLTPQAKVALKAAGVRNVYIVGSTANVSANVERQLRSGTGVAKVVRIAGATPSQRAVAAARYGGKKSDTVIIATQNGFQDALSIAPYSYATKSPILYAETGKKLSSATVGYIKSAGYRKAIVVGGPIALPASIDAQLKKAGVTQVTRLAGPNLYETSRQIADWTTGGLGNGNHGTYKGKALAYVKFQPSVRLNANKLAVSTGQNWLDALAGAALCGKNRSVMLLADAKTAKSNYNLAVDWCAAHKASIKKAYVLGGTSAVQAKAWDVLEGSTKTITKDVKVEQQVLNTSRVLTIGG